MADNTVANLSEREKETLRLLLVGHDAKSIARKLGLSVHTVNERLRDARRKLGVASSREAARLLHEAEPVGHNSLADKQIGVADRGHPPHSAQQSLRQPRTRLYLIWSIGGLLIMSLALAILFLLTSQDSTVEQPAAAGPTAMTGTNSASLKEGEAAARAWATLLDNGRWGDSWRAASALFQSQVPAAQWQSIVEPVRQPLGPVSARALHDITASTQLPGAPVGEYQLVQFQTNFAKKAGAIETVVLMHEGASWKVAGYFIR